MCVQNDSVSVRPYFFLVGIHRVKDIRLGPVMERLNVFYVVRSLVGEPFLRATGRSRTLPKADSVVRGLKVNSYALFRQRPISVPIRTGFGPLWDRTVELVLNLTRVS